MSISKKQQELDIIKWNKSVELGKDACGTFNYCACCDKSLENPCEVALNKFNAKKTTVKKVVKTACANKKTTAKAKK